ncbi:hypothetical protein FWF93_02380 [Candidatus Saccharibacteria bacterium]|nr:hypothetical protein [Candidatus Saccharibacteria bacterium]
MFGINKIQLYILRCLWEYDEITFEESRPKPAVGPGLYSYHLSRLEDLNIITKTAKGQYKLTNSGERYATGVFSKVSSKKIDIKILAHDKTGKIKIISGRLLDNDPRTHAGATRIVQKKLNCKNPNLEHIGDAYIKISNQRGDILEHTMSHIFELKNIVNISKIDESLPISVKEEILFVKKNADGHFFFERDYLID